MRHLFTKFREGLFPFADTDHIHVFVGNNIFRRKCNKHASGDYRNIHVLYALKQSLCEIICVFNHRDADKIGFEIRDLISQIPVDIGLFEPYALLGKIERLNLHEIHFFLLKIHLFRSVIGRIKEFHFKPFRFQARGKKRKMDRNKRRHHRVGVDKKNFEFFVSGPCHLRAFLPKDIFYAVPQCIGEAPAPCPDSRS